MSAMLRQYASFSSILVSAAVFALVSCSGDRRDDPAADYSFLTAEPCAAPCWHGLQLDQSSKADVLDTLKKLAFVDVNSIREYGTAWIDDDAATSIHFDCVHPSLSSCGSLLVSGDRLKNIYLQVGYHLTFQMVVDRLGTPDYVDYGEYHFEVGGCTVKLNWVDQSIAVYYLNTRSDELCQRVKSGNTLDPSIQVSALIYSVQEGFGPATGAVQGRVTWPGFNSP